ncbi:MAG: N-acetylglucosamine-6-phosphate deacetylase [Eubacteriales bacterium]
MIFKNANVLAESFQIQDFQFQEKILALGTSSPEENVQDMSGKYIVPGLIDLHSHGAMGKDASDGNGEDMDVLSKYYATVGVTACCPTTMTLKEPELSKAVKVISAYDKPVGAKFLGVYLEGPFFHYDKRGAQSAKNLAEPDYDFFKRLYDLAEGKIAVLALAPELEGGLDLVSKASQLCTVSLAHSTADYDCATAAYQGGAKLATHLFNAMMPFAHRAPGIVGAAYDAGAYGELICDGLHIHPSVVRASFQLFQEKLCLISDSLRCAGMPDGEYELGGQPITKKDGVARLHDGTLAGSSIGLLDGVKKVIDMGISPERAFYAASTAPAMALGKESEVGSLAVGKAADFLVLDKNFDLISTYVDGVKVYEK